MSNARGAEGGASKTDLRPRRKRYQLGPEPGPVLVSRTLPSRVLYGAVFVSLAYFAHVYALVKLDLEASTPAPATTVSARQNARGAEGGASGIDTAPVSSGMLERALVKIVDAWGGGA